MLIGIVGAPNKGKSTFFKAATLANVEIANRPFVTIKANKATAYVKVDCIDQEFNVQCNPREGYCINHKRFVPVELLDVAGLIPGSHEGKGLGNQFLDDLRQADIFILILDISGSTNEKGEFLKPLSYDPLKDIEFLEFELDMWFYQIMKKGFDKFARKLQTDNTPVKTALAKQLSGLKINEEQVQDVIKKLKLVHHPIEWSETDLKNLAHELRKLSKPMIIAANKIDVPGSTYNLDRLKEKYKDYLIIPCSAESELALREASKKDLIKYIPGENYFEIMGKLNDKQKNALDFIKNNVLNIYNNTGIQDILDKAVFSFLNYIAVFPGGINKLQDQHGNILPDCFLLKNGSTALDFAFTIHTDLGNKFIKAINVKTKLPIGKDYKLKHRDVIEIITR